MDGAPAPANMDGAPAAPNMDGVPALPNTDGVPALPAARHGGAENRGTRIEGAAQVRAPFQPAPKITRPGQITRPGTREIPISIQYDRKTL